MRYRELAGSELMVPVVAMGCWALGGDATWGPQDAADSIATVHAALDVGVNLFDTAEGYAAGASEEMLGRALLGRRHEAIIATKVSRTGLSAGDVRRACEGSLRRLQTDYIDLYQIHWPSRTIALEETLEALERLREEGKVRVVGVCNFGVQDLSSLLAAGRVATNQLPYSLLWRAVEYEIQPKCVAEGVGLLCYSPLAQGLLTGKFSSPGDVPEGRARIRLFSGDRPQARHGDVGCEDEVFAAIGRIREICDTIREPMARVAVAWLLHQPGVLAVIAGARRPEQIQETAAAASLSLAPEIVAKLAEVTEEAKQCVGPNADMWQSQSRFR